MTNNTIAKVSRETLIIQDFLSNQPPGTELAFQTIAEQTGVSMDQRGKQYLRSALKRQNLEYAAKPGIGIVLANEDNGVDLISHRLRQINNSVKRADRTHENIFHQFYPKMSPEDQKRIIFAGSIFGAIRIAAEQNKKVIARAVKPSNSQYPTLVQGGPKKT